MTINSTSKKIFETLWNQQISNEFELLNNNEKKIRNNFLKKQAEVIATIISRITTQSTEFETMNILERNNEIEFLYKSWEIVLTETFFIEPDILSSLIIPYIKHDIIYKEGGENNLDYYNDVLDLQKTTFYEIQNDQLILHLSTYIKKSFSGDSLIVPQAKVIVNFKNPFQVLN